MLTMQHKFGPSWGWQCGEVPQHLWNTCTPNCSAHVYFWIDFRP